MLALILFMSVHHSGLTLILPNIRMCDSEWSKWTSWTMCDHFCSCNLRQRLCLDCQGKLSLECSSSSPPSSVQNDTKVCDPLKPSRFDIKTKFKTRSKKIKRDSNLTLVTVSNENNQTISTIFHNNVNFQTSNNSLQESGFVSASAKGNKSNASKLDLRSPSEKTGESQFTIARSPTRNELNVNKDLNSGGSFKNPTHNKNERSRRIATYVFLGVFSFAGLLSFLILCVSKKPSPPPTPAPPQPAAGQGADDPCTHEDCNKTGVANHLNSEHEHHVHFNNVATKPKTTEHNQAIRLSISDGDGHLLRFSSKEIMENPEGKPFQEMKHTVEEDMEKLNKAKSTNL